MIDQTTQLLIVNADDFGYSESINLAIAECFARGYCSSTSIMANMPAFEAACEMAREQGFAAHVGVHLVLTAGEPVSAPIRRCERLCGPDGRLCLTRKERVWRLSVSEKAALGKEFRAQIARCRQRGLPLSHADSHQHVHEEWGILPVVMRACQQEGIRRIRIARNCGNSTGRARSFYRSLINRRLRRGGLACTDRFGSLADFRMLLRSRPNICSDHSVEVMIHPQFSEDGHLVDCTPPCPPVPLSTCPAVHVPGDVAR